MRSTCGESNCDGLQIAFSEHCTYMYMYILFFQQVVEKKQPEERVGVVVKCDGKYQVAYCWQKYFYYVHGSG